MDTTTDHAAPSAAPGSGPWSGLGPLAVSAIASIGAGAIHGAAMFGHTKHRDAVVAFAVLAIAQLVWGIVALTSRRRSVAAVGVVLGAGAIGGWMLASSSGISFIDGLKTSTPVTFPEIVAAGMALIVVFGSARVLLHHDAVTGAGAPRWALSAVGIGIVAVSLLSMTSAVHQVSPAAGTAAAATSSAPVEKAAVPSEVYDPSKPLNFAGVPGVTKTQQLAAQHLVAITLKELPQFSTTAEALAAGYHSIGDSLTGTEHYINWSYINDGHILDPNHPESLVYQVGSEGSRKLVAAMFMLPKGSTLDSVPNIGGNLMQWHIHDDLCFTNDPKAPVLAGITSVGGSCQAPAVKLAAVPMIHVWIVSHPCGPFAALEGIAGGQIKAGQARLCDHVHGSTF